mmetsp:Transcript_20850/g.49497  ORF Transcript_20850/g.49497 Transcript_20850/m.49497 type:complete len:235 (+) Transcript_20850:1232-1936(+)
MDVRVGRPQGTGHRASSGLRGFRAAAPGAVKRGGVGGRPQQAAGQLELVRGVHHPVRGAGEAILAGAAPQTLHLAGPGAELAGEAAGGAKGPGHQPAGGEGAALEPGPAGAEGHDRGALRAGALEEPLHPLGPAYRSSPGGAEVWAPDRPALADRGEDRRPQGAHGTGHWGSHHPGCGDGSVRLVRTGRVQLHGSSGERCRRATHQRLEGPHVRGFGEAESLWIAQGLPLLWKL